MQLCLNTSCFCSPFEDSAVPLAEKIRLTAACGYTQIELWSNELTELERRGGSLSEVKRRLDDAGLTVPSVITLVGWMDAEGEQHTAVLEECRRRMAQAAAVGSPRIVATPANLRQPTWFHLDLDHAAARYRELLELGEDLGVKPTMEFLGFCSSVYELEQAQAIVELADHPDAALVLDPFHLWRGGSGFGRVAAVPASQIGICHFNDAPADSPPRFEQLDADRVYPGDGDLPLVDLLKTIVANGYDGALSLELFRPAYWAMPVEENIRSGMAKTKEVLDAAGL